MRSLAGRATGAARRWLRSVAPERRTSTADAESLACVGGRLDVAGVDPGLLAQARRTGTLTGHGSVQLYEASPVVGEFEPAGVPRCDRLGRRALARRHHAVIGQVQDHPVSPGLRVTP